VCAGSKAGNEKRFYAEMISRAEQEYANYLKNQRKRVNMGRTLEQLLADEKPEVVAQAESMATETLLNIHLAELREKVQKTQVEMAHALGIRQPTVAGMEKPVAM
jgi:DNA-binding transcriptional regulator YiaG